MVAQLFLIILTTLFLGCGGQGTEVLSPPNPSEAAPQKIDTELFEAVVDLPQGWTFEEYQSGDDLPDDLFTDINSKTLTVASFRKGDSLFTVFFSLLEKQETLIDFIQERHPDETIEVDSVEIEELQTLEYFSVVIPEDLGPQGGFIFDFYISIFDQVLWMRAEILGTVDEMNETLNEFFGEIMPSIRFESKRRS